MKFVIAGSRPGNPSIRKKFLLLPAHDCLALDSRLRGNERSLLFTPFVPAKAGTQFFLDSRLRGNERSKSKAPHQRCNATLRSALHRIRDTMVGNAFRRCQSPL